MQLNRSGTEAAQQAEGGGSSVASRLLDAAVPGRPQLRQGERTKGTVLAMGALTTVAGLGVAQWLYGRKVDLANSFEDEYLRSVETLVPLSAYTDADGYLTRTPLYGDWVDAYDAAKSRRSIRNVAALALAGVYVVHLFDMVLPLGGAGDSGGAALAVRPIIATPNGASGVAATVNF